MSKLFGGHASKNKSGNGILCLSEIEHHVLLNIDTFSKGKNFKPVVYIGRGDDGSYMWVKHDDNAIQPPKGAEKMLYFILPGDSREQIAGDLEEEYRSVILPKFGPGYARRWYRMQVAKSIGPVLWEHLTKLIKLGILAKAAEWLSGKTDS